MIRIPDNLESLTGCIGNRVIEWDKDKVLNTQ